MWSFLTSVLLMYTLRIDGIRILMRAYHTLSKRNEVRDLRIELECTKFERIVKWDYWKKSEMLSASIIRSKERTLYANTKDSKVPLGDSRSPVNYFWIHGQSWILPVFHCYRETPSSCRLKISNSSKLTRYLYKLPYIIFPFTDSHCQAHDINAVEDNIQNVK